MLTTNDAHVYVFQVKIHHLELSFKPDKPISIMWHKDDKQSQTDKSLVFQSNNITFKDNILVLNISIVQNSYGNFSPKYTTFTIFEYDNQIKKQIGTSKFQITQIFEMKYSSYTIPITDNNSVKKGNLHFSISQKFIMKVSQFKFNKYSQLDQSEQSSVHQYDMSMSGGFDQKVKRKVSIDFGQDKSQKMFQDEVDSLYFQNKRLKTDHDKLAVKTREAQAKTKRSQKVVWWQFKQITDFYNRKLTIQKKVYEDSIQKIVFETNEAKYTLNQTIDELRKRASLAAQRQQSALIDLSKSKQQIYRLKQQYQIDSLKQRQFLQLQKNQYVNKSTDIIQTYNKRVGQLESLLQQNNNRIHNFETQTNSKNQQISKLHNANENLQKQIKLLNDKINEIQSKLKNKQTQFLKLQFKIQSIDHLLDSTQIRFYETQVDSKLNSLLNHYKNQNQKMTSLISQISKKNTNNNMKEYQQQIDNFKYRLQEKQKIIHDLRIKDDTTQKKYQNLQSSLSYQKHSNQVYSSKFLNLFNQSEIIRRQLKIKELQCIDKNELFQDINSKFLSLENQFMEIKTQKQNLQQQNQYLQSIVASMDGIVNSKNLKRGGSNLVQQLHEQIRKKNKIILQLQKRYNKIINILSQCKQTGSNLEKVIQLILDDEIQEVDDLLEQSRKRGIDDLMQQNVQQSVSIIQPYIQNSPQFPKLRNIQQQSLDSCYERFVQFIEIFSNQLKSIHKYCQKPQFFEYLKSQIQQLSKLSESLQILCSNLHIIKQQTQNLILNLQKDKKQVISQNQDLKMEIIGINKQIQKLLQGKRSSRKHTPQLGDKQRQLSQTSNILNIQLQKSKQRMKEMQMKLDHSLLECEKLQKDNNTIQQDYQADILDKERAEQKLLNQRNQLKRSLQISYQNISNLQSDISQMKHILNQQQKKYVNLNNQHNQLLQFTKSFEQKIKQAFQQSRKQTQKYQARQSTLQNQISQLRNTLSKTTVELSLLHQQIDTKTHNFFKQSQALKTTILQRQQQLKLQYKSLEEYKRIQVQDDKKIRNLQIKIRESVLKEQNLKQESNKKMNSLLRQINNLKQEKNTIEQQNRSNKNKYIKQCQRSTKLQRQIGDSEQRFNDIKRKHQQSQNELKRKLQYVEDVLSDVKITKNSVESKKTQNIELLQQLRIKQSQIQQMIKQSTLKQQLLLATQRDLQSSKHNINQIQKQILKINQQSTKIKQQLQMKIQSLQNKILLNQNEINQRELYIDQLKRSITLQSKSNNKIIQQMNFEFEIKQKSFQDQLSQALNKQLELSKQIQLKSQDLRKGQQLIKQLKQLLNNKHFQSDNYFNQNNQLVLTIRSLKESERYYALELQNYQKAYDSIKKQQNELIQELHIKNKKVQQLKYQLQEQVLISNQKHKEVETLSIKIIELQRVIVNKETQLTLKQKNYTLDISTLKSQHQSSLKKVSSQLQTYKSQHQFSNAVYQQTLQSNKSFQVQISQLNDKIHKLQKQHVLQINEIKVQYTKKDQQKSAIIDIEVSQMSAEIDSLKQQIQQLKQQNHMVTQNNTQLHTQLQQISLKIKQFQNVQTEAQKQKLSLNKKKDQQLQLLRKKTIDTNKLIEQLKHTIQSKQQQIFSLKAILRQHQFNSDKLSQLKKKNVQLKKQLQSAQESMFKQKQVISGNQELMKNKLTNIEQKYWKQITQINKQLLIKQQQLKHYLEVNKEKQQYIQNLEEKVDYFNNVMKSEERQRVVETKARRFETLPSRMYR